MSKMNLSVFLSTYSDKRASNSPSLSNFKWAREVSGIAAENPLSMSDTVAVSATKTLFTGGGTKKLVYIEVSGELQITINSEDPITLKPIVINDQVFPGVLLRTSDITSIAVTNPSADDEVSIFLAAIE